MLRGLATAAPERVVLPMRHGAENRLACIVLAAPGDAPSAGASGADDDLTRLVDRHRGHLEPLIGGALAIVLTGAATATDLCARAARCALAIRARHAGFRIALATGRAVLAGPLPLGVVIDRAAALLGAANTIHVDAVTTGLVEGDFDVRAGVLGDARDPFDGARRLLGRPTPCVGRDAELALIADVLADARACGAARAVLVTGAPGIGKSRLRHEFIARLDPGVEPWHGRGDPMRRAPYALLVDALRHAAGVRAGDPPATVARGLSAYVRRFVPEPDTPRVAEFLAEACGAAAEPVSPQLEAARASPQLMADQMGRAWEELLVAVAAARPLVLVLEDLHWADATSIQLVDAALRHCADRCVLVLALARPEVGEAFPRLWADHVLTRVELRELAPAACEALARTVLGAELSAATLARIVELSTGNAFYLEELVRTVAASNGADLPETVLAMVQARLEALPPAARGVLRAASIFGRAFWRGGVAALLGADAELDAALALLGERELIARRPDSRFTGDDELVFNHVLLREGAYAMLTDEERVHGHRTAGRWLESTGERDALVLASHFERGGERARAAHHCVRAAEQALEASDLEGALAHAERGVRLGASAETLGRLRLVESCALHWRGEYADGERRATESLRLIRPLTPPWYRAAEELAECSLPQGNVEALLTLASVLHAPPGPGEVASAFVTAASTLAMQLFLAGRLDEGGRVLTAVESAARRVTAQLAHARVHFARATQAMIVGDLGRVLEEARQTAAAYDDSGDLRNAALMSNNLGYVLMEMGSYEEAERILRTTCAIADRMGLTHVNILATPNHGRALAHLGALAEAAQVGHRAVALASGSSDRRLEGGARVYLAGIHLLGGDFAAAADEALRASAVAEAIPPIRAQALASLARARLAQELPADAVAAASEAARLLDSLGGVDDGEAEIRLVHAEALFAAGDAGAAVTTITQARARVLARAGMISDPEARAAFLERVAENARTLALASAWGAPDGPGGSPVA
jgi:tetratricopeptide (TPR) repeat protein